MEIEKHGASDSFWSWGDGLHLDRMPMTDQKNRTENFNKARSEVVNKEGEIEAQGWAGRRWSGVEQQEAGSCSRYQGRESRRAYTAYKEAGRGIENNGFRGYWGARAKGGDSLKPGEVNNERKDSISLPATKRTVLLGDFFPAMTLC
eukprot:752432-Hanusia_phi.AAC.1